MCGLLQQRCMLSCAVRQRVTFQLAAGTQGALVIDHVKTLNPRVLRRDAIQRGVLIEDASARSLFPDQQPFDQQQAQQQAKSHQQQAQQHQQQRRQPPPPPPKQQQQQQPPPQVLPAPRPEHLLLLPSSQQQQPAPQAAAPAEVSDPRRQGLGTAKPAAVPSDPRRRAEQPPAAPADPRQRLAPLGAVAREQHSAATHDVVPALQAASVPKAEAAAADMPRSYSPPLAGVTALPDMPQAYSPPPTDQTPAAAQQQDLGQQPPEQPLHGSQQRKRRGRDSDGRSQQPRGIRISVGMAPPPLQQQEQQQQQQKRRQRRRQQRRDEQLAAPEPQAAAATVALGPAARQGAPYQQPSSPESGELPEANELPVAANAEAGGPAEPQQAAASVDSSRDGAGGAAAAPSKERQVLQGQNPSLLPVQPAKQMHRVCFRPSARAPAPHFCYLDRS